MPGTQKVHKMLTILIIFITYQWERISVKCNKIRKILERGVAMAILFRIPTFVSVSVKIAHA